ncbi:MAG: SMC family ATPase [Candidatus Diapherotrites archaeon]|nr:SMC family ATPase [Candidatus Diapherotrites archaeon]
MIQSITLENWRSHKLSTLNFEKGTNVLIGVMGSGKTSVMDALCFALFGTFPNLQSRKVSLDEIVMAKPSKMQQARVRLEFAHSEKQFAVERTIFADGKANQAKLFEAGKLIAGPKPTEVSKEIERILEIDFELFSRAIYSEQNQIDSFLRLAPSERKRKFDELLELDKYETVRQNAVQVQNSLKKSASEGKVLLESFKKRLQESKTEELLEKIALKEKQLSKLENEFLEKRKILQELERELAVLSGKKKEFELLNHEFLRNSGKAEQLKAGIQSLTAELDGFELDFEKISSRKKTIEQKIKELRESEKAIMQLGSEISSLNASKRFLEDEVKAKEAVEPRSNQQLLEEVEKNKSVAKELEFHRQEIEEQFSAVKVQHGQLESQILEQKSFVQELEQLGKDSDCPTCRQKLTFEHKQQLKEESLQKISGLEKALSTNASNLLNLEAKKKQLQTEFDAASSAKNSLEKSLDILKEISLVFEKIQKMGLEISGKQNSLDAKKSGFSETEQKLVEEELKKLEKAFDAALKQKELAQIQAILEELQKNLGRLAFNPEVFQNASLSMVSEREVFNSLQSEINSAKELIASFSEQLKTLKELQAQIESLEAEISNSGFFAEKLGIFTNSLESAQSEMRNYLIEAVNAAMADVWPRVYPYKDFLSAKIDVSSGSYELVVQERSGKWQRVEGILSGGERMAAAITIRVAFSLVLARQLSWLILDEPTHNLDSNAVKVLSEMLKDHLPQLVEQVFVITHDRTLESAASSNVFEMMRNKNDDGITEVVQRSI